MERDRADSAALAPDAKRDLLGHRAARHEDGGLLAEQLGDSALEPLDAVALPVLVESLVLLRRLGHRPQPLVGARPAAPRVEEALRPADRRVDAFASGRHASSPGALPIEPLRRRPHGRGRGDSPRRSGASPGRARESTVTVRSSSPYTPNATSRRSPSCPRKTWRSEAALTAALSVTAVVTRAARRASSPRSTAPADSSARADARTGAMSPSMIARSGGSAAPTRYAGGSR